MDRTLQILKLRLLARKLNDVPDPGLHVLIMHEADTAEHLARETRHPLLFFPCLFEERTQAALERERLLAVRFWRALRATEDPVSNIRAFN